MPFDCGLCRVCTLIKLDDSTIHTGFTERTYCTNLPTYPCCSAGDQLYIDMSRQTAGTHRADTASTAGTWFQGMHAAIRFASCQLRGGKDSNRLSAGKRLPLYGVVGATFLLGGYVFFFNTAKHPESTASTSRKNQQLPGESHNKQAEGEGYCLTTLS